jgi:5-methylcytosine-specific restriction endonuclease McrA
MSDLKTCIKCGPKPISKFHKDSSRPDGLYPVCKACRKPLTAVSYVKNHDSIRAKQKADYHADPEKHRAASKEFRDKLREKDPDYLVNYNAAYYLDHKDQWKVYASSRDHEKVLAASQVYRDSHREQVRAGVRDWFRRHPHVPRLAANKRRAAWAEVEDTLTPEQLQETLEYFNHRCGYCLVDLRTLPSRMRTFDHLIAIKKGGGNTQDNVIPCCRWCNSRKKDRTVFLMARYIKSTIPAFAQAA